MKVKLFGIELRTGNGISLADFFSYLASSPQSSIEYNGHPRFLYVSESGDYHLGLLISTKDQKKFLELSQSGGDVEIVARDVSEGSQLADFNFFLIHKKTGRGIYQHYHHSCSANQFGYLARKHYEEFKTKRVASETGVNSSETELKSARKKYAGTLEWTQMVRPETFDALVSHLSQIRSFDFKFSTISDKEPVFRPLSNIAKSVTQTFRFTKTVSINNVANAIKQALKMFNIDRGRIDGMDSDGIAQVIFLECNLDSFGEFEFDAIADKMKKFLPKEFSKSWFMLEILKAAKGQEALLATPSVK